MEHAGRPPNVVLIYADDLGHGMLSCYGQRLFRTPHIDALAAEGMRCTRCYGAHMCAPARASLLSGQHECHAGRWTYNLAGAYMDIARGERTYAQVLEVLGKSGLGERPDQVFLAEIFRRAGYVTGQIGKLEWGFSSTPEDLRRHGWDFHYGYYDHLMCHGFYPPFLFRDGVLEPVRGNTRADCGAFHHDRTTGATRFEPAGCAVHSQDLFDREITAFLERHRDRPFFLHHPSQLPHGPVHAPAIDPAVRDLPGLTPVEREFASMVLRLDRTVGHVRSELARLGLAEDTLILLSSDNGHTISYGQDGRCAGDRRLDGRGLDPLGEPFTTATCGDVFDGNGGLAGLKTTSWEGGPRIPFLACWPGRIPPGTVCDRLMAHYDTLATAADLVGVELPSGQDGQSYLPHLLGDATAGERAAVVYASFHGPALVRHDGWKLRAAFHVEELVRHPGWGVRLAGQLAEGTVRTQLFHLPGDPGETRDRSAELPELASELLRELVRACDGNLLHGTPFAHFATSAG